MASNLAMKFGNGSKTSKDVFSPTNPPHTFPLHIVSWMETSSVDIFAREYVKETELWDLYALCVFIFIYIFIDNLWKYLWGNLSNLLVEMSVWAFVGPL